jgi:uncharacterized protein (DUF305 family)
MKKTTIALAVAGLTLVSAVASAQMRHDQGSDSSMHSRHGTPGQGAMHANMHGGMMQGGTMHGGKHGSMSGSQNMQPKGDTGPSSLAFHGVSMKMHSAMDIAYTGNSDVDFVKGMIPHHAGAIDMAKTVLAFGKDPEVKKFAETIIKAQETEIAQMNDWLKKNGQ